MKTMASVAEPSPIGASAKSTFFVILITAALTGVATYFAQSFADEAAVRDQSRVSEVRAFVSSGEQYEKLSADFMRDLTQKRDISTAQEALRDNLDEQYSALETAKSNLEGGRFSAAEEYQVMLAKAGRFLASDVELSESEPLVQVLMDLLNEEVCITYYLRDESGLEVSSETMNACDYP